MNRFIKKYSLTIITVVYCVIFCFLALYVGNYHEAWADEAQSWLIARDTNFIEFIKTMRYEGTPFLWHMILKMFILFGFNYEQLYYIPIIFTIIGIVFLFKNKNVPYLFKFLIPLTYFVFFQYTVVARSYCLIFPILMIIAYIYGNKEKHLVLYGILLTLLMNVSLHCTLIAGGLWLEFLYYIFKKYKTEKSLNKKELIFVGIIALLLLITVIMIYPKKDCTYPRIVRYNFFEIISEATYTNSRNMILNVIGSVLVFGIIISIIKKENILGILVILLPTILLNLVITSSPWHIGIVFILILFLIIINNSFKNKIVFVLLLSSIIVQMYWCAKSINYDINFSYSAGKEASNYIKQLDYKNKKIVGYCFHSVTLNAYFDENIYFNFDKAFYDWSRDSAEKTGWLYMSFLNRKENIDIYIIPDYDTDDVISLIRKLEKNGYTKQFFDGDMIVKDKIYEKTGFYILEK